jgi:glycosyltransferase A (GT-A) superfamily protein (DUF2064 family)
VTSAVFYIAAKPPVAGLVKTRLAQTVGANEATALYAAFVEDIGAEVRAHGLPAGWFIPRTPEWEPPALGSRQLSTRWQRGGNWSERQANLFRESFRVGNPATIIMASDSPQVTGPEMSAAATVLDDADVVLGPVGDGGYYLLGMRGDHDLVRGIEMSTDTACAEIVERVRRLELRLHLLLPTFDVDEVSDLEPLAAAACDLPHLKSTRAAMAGVGLNQRPAVTALR